MTESTVRGMAECIICVPVRVMCFTSVCLCTTQRPSAHRDQEAPSDPLELELLMVVSHHVRAGTLEPRSSIKSKHSQLLSYLPSPHPFITRSHSVVLASLGLPV